MFGAKAKSSRLFVRLPQNRRFCFTISYISERTTCGTSYNISIRYLQLHINKINLHTKTNKHVTKFRIMYRKTKYRP